MMESSILLWMIVLPAVGAVVSLFLAERVSKPFAVLISVTGLALAVALFIAFDGANAQRMQLTFSRVWLASRGIHFALGVDGFSLLPLLATKLMTPLAILSAYPTKKRPREMMACFLALDAAVSGAFLATDLVLFYVCFEALLIPMTMLVGVWGGEERIEAATKYFLITFACSICMLAAILTILATQTRAGISPTADIATLQASALRDGPLFFGWTLRTWIALGFTIAFLVKIPIFPLHPWLPYAQGEAPVGGAAMLAAVLFQLGTYGILRLAIPFGGEAFRNLMPGLAVLSLIGILYGAWLAYQQHDLKRMIAYSTLSHLSYLLLGICTVTFEGLAGTVFHGFNYGLSGGALFLLAGVLEERRRTTHFEDFGGLAENMPFFASALVIVAFSAIALPGLNGFVGEFLILVAALQTNLWWGGVALLGTIFGAAYTLGMLKKILFGKTRAAENKQLKDLRPREWAMLAPCIVLIVGLGIYPRPMLEKVAGMTNSYWASQPAFSVPTGAPPALPPVPMPVSPNGELPTTRPEDSR